MVLKSVCMWMENKPSGHFGTERARTTAHKHSEARRCPDDVKFTLKFIFACGTSAAETQIHKSTLKNFIHGF